MSDHAIATLRLFNEKVERLDRLSFTKYVRENRVGFSMSAGEGKETTFEVRGPDSEATDAFVLTLRFFVQDNEAISLRNMGKLYESLPVSQKLRDQYADARKIVNDCLDGPSMVELHGEKLANRRVLDVFLYGGLAHATPAKRSEFDKWAADEMLFGILQVIFHGVIMELLRFILWAHEHNLRAIAELEAALPAG